MRLFAGIAMEKDLRNRVAQVLVKCARVRSGVKWVTPDLLHFTVRFFGEVPEDGSGPLREALRKAATVTDAFTLEVGGFGAFPDLERPRVLFASVLRGREPMRLLAEALALSTATLGFPPPEETFHPHLTLGRVKTGQGIREAVRELSEVVPAHLGKMKAERLTLFESRLAPEGPSYHNLDEFPLVSGGNNPIDS